MVLHIMEISSCLQVECRDDVISRLLICTRYSNVPSNCCAMQRTGSGASCTYVVGFMSVSY